MHIAYVIQNYPPEVGAGPARVTELSTRWLAQGVEVTVVTALPSRRLPGRSDVGVDPAYRGKVFTREQNDGASVLRSWAYSSPRAGFAHTAINNATFMVTSSINAMANVRNVDVVIASSPPFLPHVTGRLLARLRRVPLVLEIRDLWPDYLVQMGMLKPGARATRALFSLERSLLAAAARTVVVTDSFRDRVIAKGVAPETVSVIPNGVDTAFYMPSPSIDRAKEFTVGYIGTFGAGQDLPVVIDAAAALERIAPDIRFVLVGQGPAGAALQKRVDELGVGNVTIRPPIERSGTADFYNQCDVCLVPLAPIPIFQETVPSKLFEIMACERPVLASVDGEARKIVETAEAGLVVAPGNAEAITQGILQLRNMDARTRENLGRNGRAYVTEHYNRDLLAVKYLELLRGML